MPRNYKKYYFLNEMFPNQFNTIPRILFWSTIFILDVVIIFVVAHLFGIPLPLGGVWGKIGLILYLMAAFAIFCLESYIYNKIKK